MILLLFIVIILLIIFIINKKILARNYHLLNPISIVSILWILVFLCHYKNFGYHEGTWLVYCSIIGGILSLAIGFWIGFKNSDQKRDTTIKQYNLRYFQKIIKLLILVEIVHLLYYVYIVIYKIGGGAWMMILYQGTELRSQYLFYNESIIEKLFLFSCCVFCYVGYVVTGIYVGNKGKSGKKYFLFLFLIELLKAVVSMSKLSISVFLVVMVVSYINSIRNINEQKKVLKRLLPIGVIVLVAFFVFIGFQRNYMETRDSLSSGVFDGIIDYFAGPTEALLVCMTKGVGIIQQDVYGMVDIGRTETNVFTWFFYFYTSLSYFGIIFYPFLLGVLAGVLYKPAKQDFFNDVTSTWICCFFAFSFFDFLPKFTAYQFIFVLAYLVNRFNHKIYIQRR